MKSSSILSPTYSNDHNYKFISFIRPPLRKELENKDSRDNFNEIKKRSSPTAVISQTNRSFSSEFGISNKSLTIVSATNRATRKYHEQYLYSCFNSPAKPIVYITEKLISGQLLGSMKLDFNKNFLGEASQAYQFDQIYDEIKEETVRPLISNCLIGISASIFVYGGTKSGKSYTLRGGDVKESGILQRSMKDLIKTINKRKEQEKLILKGTIYEISDNQIFDLIENHPCDNKEQLSYKQLDSMKQFADYLHNAMQFRKKKCTQNLQLKKNCLVVSVKLIHVINKGDATATSSTINLKEISNISFFELPDPNLSKNSELKQEERKNVKRLFSALQAQVAYAYSKSRTHRAKDILQKSVLSQCMQQTVNKESKMLFICCLAPDQQFLKQNQDTLNFVNQIRLCIGDSIEKPTCSHSLTPKNKYFSTIESVSKDQSMFEKRMLSELRTHSEKKRSKTERDESSQRITLINQSEQLPRPGQSSSSKKKQSQVSVLSTLKQGRNELQQSQRIDQLREHIAKIQTCINNPPKQKGSLFTEWLRDRANEIEVTLENLKSSQDIGDEKFQILQDLSKMRETLSHINFQKTEWSSPTKERNSSNTQYRAVSSPSVLNSKKWRPGENQETPRFEIDDIQNKLYYSHFSNHKRKVPLLSSLKKCTTLGINDSSSSRKDSAVSIKESLRSNTVRSSQYNASVSRGNITSTRLASAKNNNQHSLERQQTSSQQQRTQTDEAFPTQKTNSNTVRTSQYQASISRTASSPRRNEVLDKTKNQDTLFKSIPTSSEQSPWRDKNKKSNFNNKHGKNKQDFSIQGKNTNASRVDTGNSNSKISKISIIPDLNIKEVYSSQKNTGNVTPRQLNNNNNLKNSQILKSHPSPSKSIRQVLDSSTSEDSDLDFSDIYAKHNNWSKKQSTAGSKLLKQSLFLKQSSNALAAARTDRHLDIDDFKHVEEFILDNKLEDCKRDRLEKEFKAVFYKSKQIRSLLDECVESNEGLTEELGIKDEMIMRLKERHRESKKLLRELNGAVADRDQQLYSNQQQTSSLLIQIEQNQAILNEYKEKMDELEYNLQQVNNKWQQEDGNHQQFVQQLQTQIQEQKDLLLENEAVIEKQRKEEEKLIAEAEIVQKNYEAEIRQQKEALSCESALKETLMKEMEVQRSMLEARFQQRKSEDDQTKQNLVTENKDIREQLQLLERRATVYEREITLLKAQNKELTDREEKTKMNLTETHDENRVLKLKVDTSNEQLESLKRKNAELKNQIRTLENESQAVRNEKLEERIQLESTLTQRSALEGTLTSIRKELDVERERSQLSIVEIQRLKESISQLERDARRLQDEISRKSEELVQSQCQIKALQDQHQLEINNKLDKIQQLELELSKRSQKIENKKQGFEKERETLQQQVKELETQLVQEKHQNQERTLIINQLELQIRDLKNESVDQLRQNQIIEETTRERDQLREKVELFAQKIEEMDGQMHQAERAKETLKSKYMFSKYENQKVKKDYADKENKLKETYDKEIEKVEQEKKIIEQEKIKENEVKKKQQLKMRVLGDIKQLINERKKQLKEDINFNNQ